MKKIKIDKIEEIIYYEKLTNGLDIYLYPKADYHNNYVTFTTKYGSVYNSFCPKGKNKIISFPNGIAHFLEHKVFVQENDPQPIDYFSSSGSTSNAYTTFKNTTYLFSGPNNLKENIIFLLDYVQNPYFTDENVKREKGIIKREISMCNDRPSDILYDKIRSSVFVNNSFKDSVIGTNKDIDNITKDMLYECYNTFYHPSNMFLVISGNFNPEEIIKIIRDNQNNKNYKLEEDIKVKQIKEPNSIVKEEEIINIDTNISKIAYNIKIPIIKGISKRKFNLYIYILFSCLFDETSDFDENMKKKQIITNSLFINNLNCDTHMLVSLINETDSYRELFNEIENNMKNIKIKEEEFERKKKILLSNEVFSFENIEIVTDMIIDSILFENKIEEDIINIINELNIEELNNLITKLDMNNITKVILTKNTNI